MQGRTTGIEGRSASSKQIGLLPIDSIRGLEHIVPGDTEIDILRINYMRRQITWYVEFRT